MVGAGGGIGVWEPSAETHLERIQLELPKVVSVRMESCPATGEGPPAHPVKASRPLMASRTETKRREAAVMDLNG